MEPHFTVLSSIVTTWIDERCIQQTSAIPTTEWETMKRYLSAYMQATSQLGMIKKVGFSLCVVTLIFCLGHKRMACDSNGQGF